MVEAALLGLFKVFAWPAIGYMFLGFMIGLVVGILAGISEIDTPFENDILTTTLRNTGIRFRCSETRGFVKEFIHEI